MLALLILAVAGCHKPAPPPAAQQLPAIAVSVKAVENRPHIAFEEAVGTVRSKLRATISPKVSGRVEQLLVVPGQSVTAGQLLAQIDARDIQARLEQALAVKKQTEGELKRMVSLVQAGTISQAEYDRVEMQAGVAGGQVKEMQTLLGFAKITAPFAGVITRKISDVGDLAAPGQALLEMEDPATLRLEADVPEALIDRVKMGAKLSVRISALPQSVEGVVSELDPVGDPNSRTFKVKLDLPPQAGLRSGAFGRVSVPVDETTTLRVPVPSVVVRGQMEIVFVVVQSKAQLRLVKTGKQFGGEVELVSGVKAGEMVVTESASQLVDGQPVTLK